MPGLFLVDWQTEKRVFAIVVLDEPDTLESRANLSRAQNLSRAATAVIVADSYGECISDVGGFWQLGQPQLMFDGELHLFFGSSAIAGQCFLDLGRGIGMDGQTGLSGGQQDHAPGVAHQNGRHRAFVMRIQLLYRHAVGMKLSDDLGDPLVEFQKPAFKGLVSVATNKTGIDQCGCSRGAANDSVSGDAQGGVDPQNKRLMRHSVLHGNYRATIQAC